MGTCPNADLNCVEKLWVDFFMVTFISQIPPMPPVWWIAGTAR